VVWYGLCNYWNACLVKITAIKQQLKRTNRYSIFVDGSYAFSVSESALLDLRLASGQEFESARLEELKKISGDDKIYGNALRYVAIRPRSEWELRTYLQRKMAEEPVIQDVIGRLQKVGLLDDEAFARAWAANRRLLKNISKRRLRLELQQKHVPGQVIDTIMRDDETNERDVLRDIIEKKKQRYPDQNKLMQYLARQGFNYDDIKNALNNTFEDY